MRTSPAIPSSDHVERVARTARRGATIAAPSCKATQETLTDLQPAPPHFGKEDDVVETFETKAKLRS
jgi:hypothetical protein